MRLKDIITKLNISLDRAVEFLVFNGFQQDYSITTKLNKEEIKILTYEFKKSPTKKTLEYKSENIVKKKNLDYELIDFLELRSETIGFDFKKLFGEYLTHSKHIVISDPYLRLEYQIRNLIELIHTILELSNNLKSINVITGYDNIKQKNTNTDTFEAFSKIAKQKFKFDFNYSFDLTIHDRKIEIDKSILIILGRGLDVYSNVNKYSHQSYHKLKLKKSFLIILKKTKHNTV